MTVHEAMNSVQRMGQSAGAQLAWVAAKCLVTLFITGSLAMAVGYVRDMRDDLRSVSSRAELLGTQNQLQDQSIASINAVSAATISTLKALSEQVSHNTYDVDTLKKEAAQRPRR